ncbi:MAG: thiamine-phosphate kinase [Candidatus Thorarchaeota archaeon]
MRADEMGERAFLESIKHLVSDIDGAVLGFDDDASDIPLTTNQSIVVNVDTFVRETDWLPDMTEAQVGWKTAVMAISDLVAKGASPIATMLSLCMPKDYPVSDAEEIIRGFSHYCMKSGVPFIGGDLGMASDVVLTAVAIGKAPPDGIIARSGAHDGDAIAVTGSFGLTSVAYEILLKGKTASSDLRSRTMQAGYKPNIHIGFVSSLVKIGAITSSMDSSDGLGITLNTMAKQSNLSFVIDNLPIAEGVESFSRENNLDALKLVMQGGEEFILVVTIPDNKWNDALELAQKMKVPLTKIGHTQKGIGVVFESSEGYVEISSKGYDNLREWA